MSRKIYSVLILLLINIALTIAEAELSCYICTDCPEKNKLVTGFCHGKPTRLDDSDNEDDDEPIMDGPEPTEGSETETTTLKPPETTEPTTTATTMTEHSETTNATTTTKKPIYGHACYMAKIKSDKGAFWKRGCIAKKDADTFCKGLQVTGKVDSCKVCNEPNCNSSSKLAISTVFVIFLAVLVYNY